MAHTIDTQLAKQLLPAPQIRFLDLVRVINDFIVLYCITIIQARC